MKRIISLVTILAITLGLVFAQNNTDGPQITFDKKDLTYDFGKVKQNSKAEYKFTFKNTGNKPLVITNVVAGCSCTTPVWPKTAILPGKKDGITVGYKTDRIGPINRTITVKSNTGQDIQLKIIGEVIE